jgi:hypothetical protein
MTVRTQFFITFTGRKAYAVQIEANINIKAQLLKLKTKKSVNLFKKKREIKNTPQ